MADQTRADDLTVLHQSQCDTAFRYSNLPLISLQQVVQQRRTFPRYPLDCALQHACAAVIRILCSCASSMHTPYGI